MQPMDCEQRIVTTRYSRKLNEIRLQWEDGFKCIEERDTPKGKVTLVFEKIIFMEPQKPSQEMKDKFKEVKEKLDNMQFKLE